MSVTHLPRWFLAAPASDRSPTMPLYFSCAKCMGVHQPWPVHLLSVLGHSSQPWDSSFQGAAASDAEIDSCCLRDSRPPRSLPAAHLLSRLFSRHWAAMRPGCNPPSHHEISPHSLESEEMYVGWFSSSEPDLIWQVRSLNLDSWNDDWVDNMERWGNARATAFWEARTPGKRPSAEDSNSQVRCCSKK